MNEADDYEIFPTEPSYSPREVNESEDSEDEIEGCPFCDEYTGDSWKNHASAAHPEQYKNWKGE